MPANATLLPGGTEEDCVERKTCFASMSAALPVGGGSNQQTNYANFDMFSETLLAGVLAEEFELAIMDFRESRAAPLQRRLLLAHASDTDLRSRLFVGYWGENHRGSSRHALVCAWQIAGRFWA